MDEEVLSDSDFIVSDDEEDEEGEAEEREKERPEHKSMRQIYK